MTRESIIVEQIREYTAQLELYERTSTYYSVACMIAVIMLIGIIVLLIMKTERDAIYDHNDKSVAVAYKILPVLFLLIPSIAELYLYTFAMNMRKGAMYRGYLSFLENKLNERTGSVQALFDSELVDRFLSTEHFPVNGIGPAAMGIFLLVAILSSFLFAIYYTRLINDGIYKKIMKLVIVCAILMSVIFDSIYVYSLSINGDIVREVEQYCIEMEL